MNANELMTNLNRKGFWPRGESPQMALVFEPEPFEPTLEIRHKVIIEFDGGTPCNVPVKGYGDGYGSYQIRNGGHAGQIVRIKFNRPMSANVAEISTLLKAIERVLKTYNPHDTQLMIYGDSQIALTATSATVA